MPDKANDPLPKAPDLSEAAQAIARGGSLLKRPSGYVKRRISRSKVFNPPSSKRIALSIARTSSWATRRRAVHLRPRQSLRTTRRHDTNCALESDARRDAESTV
jgi:hypothetical protein